MPNKTISIAGGNWNSAATWDEGVVPALGDTVVARGTGDSGNVVVNTNTNVLAAIDFTNYSGTISGASSLIVGGNVTLSNTMTISLTTAGMTISAAGILTSNGKSWTAHLTLTGIVTYTLADNWTVTGTLTLGSLSTGGTQTLTGFQFSCTTSLVCGVTSNLRIITGTTLLKMTGTGTLTAVGTCRCDLTIDTAGTITLSGTMNFQLCTLTYVTGSVTQGASILSIGNSVTFNTGTMNWFSINFSSTAGHILSSNLNCTGTIFTTNGGTYTFTGAFNISAGAGSIGGTTNLSGNLTITGATNFVSTATILNGVSFTVFLGGSITFGTGNVIVSGTAGITFNNAGTWANFTSNNTIKNAVTINTSGTIVWGTNVVFGTGGFTYTAGTITTAGSTVNFNLTCSISASGLTFAGLTFSGTSQTYTLLTDLVCSGLLSFTGTTATVMNGLFVITSSGGLTQTTVLQVSGSADIKLTGGTWTGGATLVLRNTLEIAGNLTIGTNVAYNTGTITYTSGTVTTTGSTLTIATSTTLDTDGSPGITWNNIVFSAGGTMTLNSLLRAGFIGINTTVIFAGSFGFTTSGLTLNTAGVTHTLATGVTYTITGPFICTGATSASHTGLTSSNGVTSAILILSNNGTATCDLGFVNATRIDSSAGQTIWTRKGTLTTATNWSLMPSQPVSYLATSF